MGDLFREDDDGIIRAPWQTKDDDDDNAIQHRYRDDDDGILAPLYNGRFVPGFYANNYNYWG